MINQIFSFSIILIFSLFLSVQDVKKMSVNLYILWAAILSALVCQVIFTRETAWIYILSGILCGAFYFIVRKITKGKLGTADVLFGIFQGLFLVPKLLPLCFGIECLVTLFVINQRLGKERFPFIPFMSVGLITTFIIQVIFM